MNEQKVIKFCMLILKSIGHCFGFLVAMTVSRADNYGCFWQTSSCPCKTCIQKRHAWKKRKNNTKTETEISETVIRLQHIFSRAATSSKALKASHTVLTNVTLCLPTLSQFTNCLQTFLHQKRWNFHQTEAQRPVSYTHLTLPTKLIV